MDVSRLSDLIKNYALNLGFDACGFAKAGFMETEARRLEEWLNQDRQATMDWMGNHFEKRVDPTLLVPGAKSVISVLASYHHPSHQHYELQNGLKIAKYAQGRDYHRVVKKKLKELFNFIDNTCNGINGRYFVDSAPVLDKAWAVRAGLGWIGKHSNLINKEKGSYFFIGEIILDTELVYNTPLTDHCGSCTKCIEACPTDAIYEPYRVDSAKCISYLTIEHRDEFSKADEVKLNEWIFGCDICQDVCPWNKFSVVASFADLHPKRELNKLNNQDWERLNEANFDALFEGSAVKRTKYKGLKRNINAALLHTRNSGYS